MSIWLDIHKQSSGETERKEDRPAVDPEAERKRREDTARWYAIQELKRQEKRKHYIRVDVICFLGAINLGFMFLSVLNFEPLLIPLAFLFGLFVFLASRAIIFNLMDDEDDW